MARKLIHIPGNGESAENTFSVQISYALIGHLNQSHDPNATKGTQISVNVEPFEKSHPKPREPKGAPGVCSSLVGIFLVVALVLARKLSPFWAAGVADAQTSKYH